MTDEQTAAAIVADSRNACDETAMEAAIVRALQAARTPPPGHIIDDAGVVRRVLGTLPVTADGCVVGSHEDGVVMWDERGSLMVWAQTTDIEYVSTKYGLIESARAIIDREAAEAAKEEKK